MAKAKVQKEAEIELQKEEVEFPKLEISETTENENVSVTENVEVVYEVKEIHDTDEVLFLKKLLEVQEKGGWGRNLHPLINDRINELKSK